MKHLPGTALLAFLLLLLVPSLFYNLGLVAITADEPTRANVAMEMMYSGNYLVSTIAGEYYYKKPPLFNWLLVLMYYATGSKSELVTRLAAVIPLLLFAFRIFAITRKHLSKETALLAAFMFLTFGRMLYYDSMLGHIDILYAWVTFESFYLLYAHFETDKKWLLFLGFYILHAIGFMFKGLPSLLFPAFTLLAMAIHRKKFRWIFSWEHLLGAIAAFVPVVLFFYAYSLQNSLYGWVEQLWDQSKQRTVLDKSTWESIRHLFLFPVDHLMHLAPWSLLTIFLFRNKFAAIARKNPFLRYLFWVLLINLPPYWLSPGYYPRYLFMLYPILFIFLSHALWNSYEKRTRDAVITHRSIMAIMWLVSIAFVCGILYLRKPLHVEFFITVTLLVITLAWLFAAPSKSVWIFVAFMLVTRIAFNLYALPDRKATGKIDLYKTHALYLSRLSRNQPLAIAPNTPLGHDYIYYLERERNQPLPIKKPDTTGLFISVLPVDGGLPVDTLAAFPIDYEQRTLYLVKVK